MVPTDEVQTEARALGDPTRYRLFRYIVDAGRPVGVAELTEYLKLNHNAIRQHLAVLKEANLVVEAQEARDKPGRPRLFYEIHPEAAGNWGTPGSYVWLAGLLSDAVRRRVSPRQVGRKEGRRRAPQLSLSGATDSADLLEEEMIRRGFRPKRSERGGRVEFVLGRCPFADVASEDPDTVCQLHLGLAEGLTEGLGDLRVERLIQKNARRAGCRLVVQRR